MHRCRYIYILYSMCVYIYACLYIGLSIVAKIVLRGRFEVSEATVMAGV